MTMTTTDRLSNDIGNGDDDDGDRGDGDGGRDEPDGPSYDEQAWIDTKGIVHKRTTAQDKQCFKKADNAREQCHTGASRAGTETGAHRRSQTVMEDLYSSQTIASTGGRPRAHATTQRTTSTQQATGTESGTLWRLQTQQCPQQTFHNCQRLPAK